jgi:hypothetical protein
MKKHLPLIIAAVVILALAYITWDKPLKATLNF